ncbi:MAG: hypothetical protein Q9170_003767 [Blastenia crenularia]
MAIHAVMTRLDERKSGRAAQRKLITSDLVSLNNIQLLSLPDIENSDLLKFEIPASALSIAGSEAVQDPNDHNGTQNERSLFLPERDEEPIPPAKRRKKDGTCGCQHVPEPLLARVQRQSSVQANMETIGQCWQLDGNIKLVSYPYYAKYASSGDAAFFRHIDMNVSMFPASNRGANIIQGSVSLDEETKDGCTEIVPGFWRNIKERWRRVGLRGSAATGFVHSLENRYTEEDVQAFVDFVPVVRG